MSNALDTCGRVAIRALTNDKPCPLVADTNSLFDWHFPTDDSQTCNHICGQTSSSFLFQETLATNEGLFSHPLPFPV